MLDWHVRPAEELDEVRLRLLLDQLLSAGDVKADYIGPDGDQYVLAVLAPLPRKQFENVWEDAH